MIEAEGCFSTSERKEGDDRCCYPLHSGLQREVIVT